MTSDEKHGWCYCIDLCGEYWETAASREEAIQAALKDLPRGGTVRIGTTRWLSNKDMVEGTGSTIHDLLISRSEKLMGDLSEYYPGFVDTKELESLLTKYLDTKLGTISYFVVENMEIVNIAKNDTFKIDPNACGVKVTGLEILSKKVEELEKKLAIAGATDTSSIHKMYALMCNGSVEAVYRSEQEADDAVKKKRHPNSISMYSYYVGPCLVLEQKSPSLHYWIIGSAIEATHLMVP